MESFSFTTSQLGKQLFYYENCDSTNRVAANLIQNGKAKHGTLVLADFQTAGRGQQKNNWESAPGDNLTFSLILFPNLEIAHFFRLNMVVSIAVAQTLNSWVKDDVEVKWPNDIFYRHQKLGGILIQNMLQGTNIKSSVVGIGLNVNQLYFSQPRAVSLANIRNQVIDRNELLNQLLVRLEQELEALPATTSNDVLHSEYESMLYGKGESRTFEDENGLFEGIISGVTTKGELRIKRQNSEQLYKFHEIKYRWG